MRAFFSFLLRLTVRIEHYAGSFNMLICKVNNDLRSKVDGPTITQRELDELTQSAEDFVKVPNELAATLSVDNDKYRDIVRQYFVMKQASALYEAEYKELPIQVFNEMRNALDHFIRSLIYPSEESRESSQLDKMKGHVQRAFLDSAKMLCAAYDQRSKSRHERVSDVAAGQVNNGDYLKEYTRLQVLAHQAFTQAKLQDYQLGVDGNADEQVRKAYLDAVIAHKKLYDYQSDNYHHLRWAKAKLLALRGLTLTAGIVASLVAGILLEIWLNIPELIKQLTGG